MGIDGVANPESIVTKASPDAEPASGTAKPAEKIVERAEL